MKIVIAPDSFKESLSALQVAEAIEATNESVITHRLNDMLALLTIISAVILPLTFITGFFGMNFGREFAQIFFAPQHPNLGHYGAIAFVVFLARRASSSLRYANQPHAIRGMKWTSLSASRG